MTASPLTLAATIDRSDPIVKALLEEIETQAKYIEDARDEVEQAKTVLHREYCRNERQDALMTSLYILVSRGPQNDIDSEQWPNAGHDTWQRAVFVAIDLVKQESESTS